MRRIFLLRSVSVLIIGAFLVEILVFIPKTAYAQWVTTSPDLVALYVQEEVTLTAKEALRQGLVSAVATLLINLITQVANNAARDAAIWVASGGNADEPLFEIKTPTEYLQNAAMGVVAELYNELADSEGGFSRTFSIYLPTDPELLQSLRLGLRAVVQDPVIESDYPDVKKNWNAYLATMQTSDATAEEKTAAVLAVIAEGFDPRVNEVAAGANMQLTSAMQAQSQSNTLLQELLASHGYKPVVDFITGNVTTPASLVENKLKTSIENADRSSTDIAKGLLTNTDTLLQIGVSAASIFSNTLLSELLNKVQSGLFDDIAFNDSDYDPFDEDSITSYSRQRIVERYSTLNSFRSLSVTDFNLLSELSSCPSAFRGSSRSLYSCAMDSSFASAVSRSSTGDPLTLEQAIEDGYINGDWPLIPSDDTARNQDSKCYTYGFCHSNLVKLRKARVIPLGWELATESDSNSETNPVTLSEVTANFNSCNSSGEIDADNPWCHLIDPNWVLKFPETQCRTLAYGQLLSAGSTDQRSKECVDIQSCVTEDEDGNCSGGYGYCVREQNVWRFRGDECPEQYASCMTFASSDDKEVSYLTNTIDYGDCDASNLGCLWYATQKEEADDGSYDFPEIPNVEYADELASAYKNRLYFTSSVETCDESDGGCEQLISREDSVSLNMIANSSFETDSDSDSLPDSWLSTSITYDTENNEGRNGKAAVNIGTAGRLYQYFPLQQHRFYTMTAYAKQDTSGGSGKISIYLGDENGNDLDVSAVSYSSDTCAQVDNSFQISASPTDTDYERVTCTFTTPGLTDDASEIIGKFYVYGTNIWLDDIQLEQSEEASVYHSGYNITSFDYAYLKVAPKYLGCTGDDDDPSECDSYARMCAEQDAGCSLYTPVNGDPSVSAVVSELDECPAGCAGYDTFRQEDTLYEPDGEFPIYFIPSTAIECSEESVGCDEFTNLTTEQKEYYSYLRACVTEDQAGENTGSDNAAIFYTWEGSDVEGYQLKTWTLLESNLNSSTYGTYTYKESTTSTDSAVGSAPCTNWESALENISCADNVDGDSYFDTDSAECDEHDDIIENPDCREFYDVDGVIHYREWSKTVTVNNACVSYRKTEIAGDNASDQEVTCEQSGGYYDSDGGFCRYYGYSEESTVCDESQSGCRKYTGGRSANSRVALKDTFEGGTLSNWDASSATSVTLSNESIATDGHSLKSEGIEISTYLYEESGGCADEAGCDSSTGTLGGTCSVSDGSTYCGTLEAELYQNKVYSLSFWAKGDTDISAYFKTKSGEIVYFDEIVDLGTGWQQFSAGPLDMYEGTYDDFGAGTVLVFSPITTGSAFYIDNIVLREGEDDITVIKDSWNTPAICDETPSGAQSDQYHLGCAEYIDQNGDTSYLKSFSSLCDEDKVGCQSFYKTHQSESEYVNVYNATCYNIDTTDDGSGWTAPDVATEKTTCYLAIGFTGIDFDTTSKALCTIITGETSCQFDMEDWSLPEMILSGGADFSVANYYHIKFGPDTTIVDADNDVYLIASDEFECSESSVGCTEVGLPTFSDDQSAVDSWESVWLMNLPDDYSDILCSHAELFCDAWESTSEGTWYFKNPGGHVCEYKIDLAVGGEKYSGWFQTGTNEFCYGTGSCSGDTTVDCSTDADCAETEAGECVVDTGSYLIGGNESGIWRNGDSAYDGWVGGCSSEYDGCTQYQDPVDVDDSEFYQNADGEEYFFLDNDNLDENTLLSSQRCDGQVSQTAGCVLFNDTGDATLDYNASATYISSLHADALTGDDKFALVDPIDCDDEDGGVFTVDGEEIDLCARRCVYKNSDLDSSFDITQIYEDDLENYSSFGGSCYEDGDCPAYESDIGDLVDGDCAESAKWLYMADLDSDGIYETAMNTSSDTPRLENDTNTVLKVNRDRECSEWLACSSSYTVWDENTGQYKTICDGVDLCTEYSAQGHPSFCSDWDAQDPAVVLDEDKYTSRDISWYGEEYSGYSVANMFPLEHLSQVNIAPPVGTCDLRDLGETSSAYEAYHGESCETDADCGSSGEDYCADAEDGEEYRLGFVAGVCEQEHGEDCTVGYCDNSGAVCVNDGDCESSGDCVTGVCYEFSETVCSSDDDCTDDQECIAGACVTDGGYCDEGDVELSYACESGETCVPSVATKEGTCFQGSCFLAGDGSAFDSATHEAQACRAQPELNSPFPTSIVKEWKYLDFSDAVSDEVDISSLSKLVGLVIDSEELALSDIAGADKEVGTDNRYGGTLPYSYMTGFGRVKTCATGEDCECFYKKVQDLGGNNQYIAYGTELDDVGIRGMCSSDSPVSGALCGDDDDCRVYVDRGSFGDSTYVGTCEPLAGEEKFIGLDGYCLERDTGINIQGDQNTGACLTWFPVDQLKGGTDLYAKYTGAGFVEDAYYCLEVKTYSNQGAVIGTGAWSEDESEYPVTCPDEYWAVQEDNEGPSETFVCVPNDSYHTEGDDIGEKCDKPSDTSDISSSGTEYFNTGEGESDFIDAYGDCVRFGVPIDNWLNADTSDLDLSDYYNGYIGGDFGVSYDLESAIWPFTVYPACDSVIKASSTDGDDSVAPWTDRLLNEDEAYSLDAGNQTYYPTTISTPFGIGPDIESASELSYFFQALLSISETWLLPAIVPACMNGDLDYFPVDDASSNPTTCASESTYQYSSFGNKNSKVQAREFVQWTGYEIVSGSSSITTSDSVSTVLGRLSDLFANIEEAFSFSVDDTGEFIDSEYTDYDGTFSGIDVRAENGNPPTVWAVDIENCGGSYCPEGDEGAVTLNNQNTGNLLGTGGFFRSTMKFYAAADKNQLPLRRIIVDWQDGGEVTGSDDTENYYKNHRGLQEDSTSVSMCDLCSNDLDSDDDQDCEWGLTGESCDPNYFNYSHTYRCSSNDLDTLSTCTDTDGDSKLDDSPCLSSEGDRCVYQPRVHVRDNWGFCAGTCTYDIAGEGDSCFDADGLSVQKAVSDECYYDYYPDEAGSSATDPWVYYDGYIYVEP